MSYNIIINAHVYASSKNYFDLLTNAHTSVRKNYNDDNGKTIF